MLKQDGVNENRSTGTGGTRPLPRRRTQSEAPVSSTLQEESESQMIQTDVTRQSKPTKAVRTPPPAKREEETLPWLQVFQNVYYDFDMLENIKLM